MRKLTTFVLTFTIMLAVLAVANRKTPDLQPPAQKPDQPAPLTFEQAKNTITEQEVRQHLYYLTSPDLEGRMSGQSGNRKAADYIVGYHKKLGLVPSFNNSYLQPFSIRNLNEFKEKGTGETANVIAHLPGNDPVLKDEYIIIGAHFDHIGYGPSMSQAPNRREVHPGADDNASGTVLVMATAKGFASLHGQNRRTIVFIHFSAEEMGLLGAKYYCNRPVFPLQKTYVMINQDMIGRLNGQTVLTANGAGKNSTIAEITNGIQGYPFKARATGGTGGGSDHAAFADSGVPVIFFHTGQHAQYHTPDDTADRIDVKGLHKISQFVFELAWKIDKIPAKATQVRYENISFDVDHK